MNEDRFRRLLDAGFTAAELRSISTDLSFAAIVAEEGQGISLPASRGVDWTPEKRAAWNAAVGEFLARVRHPEDDS